MLTDIELRGLKGKEKPYKRSDGGGLFVLVNPDGKKFWRLAYRFDGKQKALSHGRYPEIGLRAARDFRDAIRFQLRRGLDPAVARSEDARFLSAKVAHSFEEVAREWILTRKLAWSPRYAALVVGRLEADIFPEIGAQAINAIMPGEILVALRRVESRGAVEMAHRIKNHVSEIFRFAIPDGRCESDPCRDLSPALSKPKPVEHQAKVSAKELPHFFAKLREDQGARLSHLALRWTILTMVRSQETRFAEWSEFEGIDGQEPLWRIPAKRMKMRSEHLVPLPRQAVALLKEIHSLNVYRKAGNMRLGAYLFPVANAKSLVISENRMLDIMYRVGLRGKATVHGFRGLASTVLNETGLFEGDWIEHQLAHQPRGVRAAYNAARYLAHRTRMMQWWADYLEQAEEDGMGRPKLCSVATGGVPIMPELHVIPWDDQNLTQVHSASR